MKFFNLRMLATILTICGAMTIISCSDSDPVAGNGEIASWIYDGHMDRSVKPGDDFYMFCNGTYWNNTQVNELGEDADDHIKGYRHDEYKPFSKRMMEGVTYPAYEKFELDFMLRISPEQLTEARQLLSAGLHRLNEAGTKEEFWTQVGQLMKAGYNVPFQFLIYQKDGTMCCTILPSPDDEDDDGEGDADTEDLQYLLNHNAKLRASMHPVLSQSTRSVDGEAFPMCYYIAKGLGFTDAQMEHVYALPPQLKDADLATSTAGMQKFQDQSLEDLGEWVKGEMMQDLAFYDEEYINNVIKILMPDYSPLSVMNKFEKYFFYEKSKNYAEHVVTPEMQTRTMAFLEELRGVFRQRIYANKWLSDGSKAAMIEKLDAMSLFVGKPDTWIEEGVPDLSKAKTLQEDLLCIRKAYVALQMKLVGMDKDEASFHYVAGLDDDMNLSDVNACYLTDYNSFYIYPAWMAEPFYSPSNEDAVNYAIFMIFAHEMIHGFDNEGAYYDKDGDKTEKGLFVGGDEAEFQRRTQMLVDCYSQFDVLPGVLPYKNNGQYTLAENIADLGGFEIAYDAFVAQQQKKGVSGDELTTQKRHFYQAFANFWRAKYTAYFAKNATIGSDSQKPDVHSLSKERVNGVVCNTDAWYDLFDVKEGQKLYLPQNKRAHIW